MVTAVLDAIGDAISAEDVVSEVFLTVWRHADGFKARAQVSTMAAGDRTKQEPVGGHSEDARGSFSAAQRGMPASTVKTRMFYARRMREILQAAGHDSIRSGGKKPP